MTRNYWLNSQVRATKKKKRRKLFLLCVHTHDFHVLFLEIPEMTVKQNGKRQAPLVGEDNKENVKIAPGAKVAGDAVPLLETPTAKAVSVAAARLPSPRKSPAPIEAQLTCECCYGDYAFEDMTQCDNGDHLFCRTCVRDYVREQLFGQDRNDFPCMSSDGCKSSFSSAVLEQALSPRLIQKVDEHRFRAEVSMAQMTDLW